MSLHPFDVNVLDSVDDLDQRDPRQVLMALASAGGQVRRAVDRTLEADLERLSDDRPRAVLIAGRGSTTVVGDALSALVGVDGQVPVLGCTGPTIPPWVGPLDVVVVLSTSGRSDLALRIAHEAGRRGARLLVVTAGGSELAGVAREFRGVVIELPEPGRDAVSAPTTRSQMWSLLTPTLVVAHRLGLIRYEPDQLYSIADLLDDEAEHCRPSSDAFVNPAKILAQQCAGRIPVLLGGGPVAAVAARRGASSMARTARVPAVPGELPHAAGEVVSMFGGLFARKSDDDIFADPLAGDIVGTTVHLVLIGQLDNPLVNAVKEIADDADVSTSMIECRADTQLGRFAQASARLDFAATYLAIATGIDPSQSPHLADLRDSLG